METKLLKNATSLFFLIFIQLHVLARTSNSTNISGSIILDDTWESKIFLSHIPTFDDMFLMSNEMIIAEAELDSIGNFQFNIDFLPKEYQIYRLHLIKKGNPKAMLIIGGKDENHIFLIANRFSDIELTSVFSYPPFKNVVFGNSTENINFHKVRSLIFSADSSLSKSGAAKRELIKENLEKDLLQIVDTSSSLLVSLYAIYNSNYPANYHANLSIYKSFNKKWKNHNSTYYDWFLHKTPQKSKRVVYWFLLSIIVISSSFFAYYKLKNNKLKKLNQLSIQERKIFEMIKQGASNQEISDHFNVGLSTVKSHISRIYSKLNIKSRKEIIDFSK